MFLSEDITEVHVSCTFTQDKKRAEYLAEQWERIAPVSLGGVAYGMRGEEFVPGLYMKHGYVITSRGCPNRCWFCSVWKRDGNIRELAIKEGWMIQDDNLLACSDVHVQAVFSMLKRQPCLPEFTGGLDSRLLRAWHIEAMQELKTKQFFLAYDTPDDYESLIECSKLLKQYHIPIRQARCFVLIGYKNDTKELASKRLESVVKLGMMPFAMLYQDSRGNVRRDWKGFQREWANPFILGCKIAELNPEYAGLARRRIEREAGGLFNG